MNPNQLRKLSRKSFGWAITSTILLTINVSLSLYVAWVYHQISLYGHIFGWGNIPLEVFPIPPEQVEGVFKVIGWLGVATVLSALGAFLFCMTQVRNAIEEVTQNVLLLNWRYTILSLFIPIWCLYRPWLGFAEVRRAATGIARRKSLSPSWRTDGFNFATFALAFVWYVLGCGFSLVIGKVIEQEGDKDITLGTLDLIQRLTTWQIGVDSIFFATLIWYMFSLCRALGSISALVSFTHVSKRSFHGTIAS